MKSHHCKEVLVEVGNVAVAYEIVYSLDAPVVIEAAHNKKEYDNPSAFQSFSFGL